MIQFLVIDIATGDELRRGRCAPGDLEMQVQPGASAVRVFSETLEIAPQLRRVGNGFAAYEQVRSLHELRADKLAAISAQFEREVVKGCASPKGRVDCDDKAQGRVSNVISLRERAAAAGIDLDATVMWTMFDQSQEPHSDAELIGLGIAIGFGFAAKFARKQALEAEALAAMDIDALAQVDPASGWPA